MKPLLRVFHLCAARRAEARAGFERCAACRAVGSGNRRSFGRRGFIQGRFRRGGFRLHERTLLRGGRRMLCLPEQEDGRNEQRCTDAGHDEADYGRIARLAVGNDHVRLHMGDDLGGIARAEEIAFDAPIHKAAVLIELAVFTPVVKDRFDVGGQRLDLCIFKVKLRNDGGQGFVPCFFVDFIERVVITLCGFERDEVVDVAILRNERNQVIQFVAVL